MKIVSFLFVPALSLAAALSPADAQPAAISPASNAIRIGAAAAVHGVVQAAATGAVGRVISSGKPLYLNDHVTTDSDGRLQVMLLDETIFTIGPNSDLVLDEFVYDPATSAGKVTARVAKGVFRFVTGKVARKEPSNMKVDLPVGTIGIRGTIVEGQVDDKGATVILDGPGAHNNANEAAGAIIVEAGVDPVTIDRPGYGVTIQNGRLSPVTDMSQRAQQISNSLQTKPESKTKTGGASSGQGGTSTPSGTTAQGGDKGASQTRGFEREQAGDEGGPRPKGGASDQAGQTTAEAVRHVNATEDTSVLSTALNNSAAKASEDNSEKANAPAHGIVDGLSKWDDVRTITTGIGHYAGSGTVLGVCSGACSGRSTGNMSFDVAIDFGAKTLGGSGSNISFSGSGFSAFATVNPVSFSSLSGKAAASPTFSDANFNGTTISLINAGGVPAANAAVNLNYTQTGFSPNTPFAGSKGTLTVTGSGTAPLQNGSMSR